MNWRFWQRRKRPCYVMEFDDDGKMRLIPSWKTPLQDLCLLAMSYGPRTSHRLRHTCHVDDNGLMRELTPLIDRGLVAKDACEHDDVQEFSLTDHGRQYVRYWKCRDWVSIPNVKVVTWKKGDRSPFVEELT